VGREIRTHRLRPGGRAQGGHDAVRGIAVEVHRGRKLPVSYQEDTLAMRNDDLLRIEESSDLGHARKRPFEGSAPFSVLGCFFESLRRRELHHPAFEWRQG
jgi:hypothetical protein